MFYLENIHLEPDTSLFMFWSSFISSMQSVENTIATIIASIELVMIVMKFSTQEIGETRNDIPGVIYDTLEKSFSFK